MTLVFDDSKRSSSGDSAAPRVLIVDDMPEIHADFRRILEIDRTPDRLAEQAALVFSEPELFRDKRMKVDYRIDSAYQGQEALKMVKDAIAQGDPYWLAFVDMRMPPGWDGLETIRRIWEVSPDIHAVICTAYTDHSWEEMVGALGTSDRILFLHKPFGHIEIQQAALTLTTKWRLAEENRLYVRKLEQNLRALQDEFERRTQAEERAEFHAEHDPLTGLANRQYFLRQIDALRESTSSLSVPSACVIAAFDIDGFRVISNGLQHNTVDQLIVAFARRLRTHLRGKDDLAARASADRFLLLLADVGSEAEGIARIQEISSHLASPFEVETGQRIRLSTSVGVTFSAKQHLSGGGLLVEADLALNAAKGTGRGKTAVFDPDMHRANILRMELEGRLRDAIEANRLSLHYQPIVDLTTSKITGFEALCRWIDPERGFISPADFIPVAEDSGLIITLGRWALREACSAALALRQASGLPLTVSVNVSAMQLFGEDFVSDFQAALETTGCPGEAIRIEITESGIMRDPAAAAAILAEIRKMATHIYIDDFGTGYSSLAYLRRLPVDTLKIDRCFVSPLETSEDDQTIVRTIIQLASTMNLQVVAEGIETAGQATILRNLGCTLGQGYHYSRPIALHAAVELVQTASRAA